MKGIEVKSVIGSLIGCLCFSCEHLSGEANQASTPFDTRERRLYTDKNDRPIQDHAQRQVQTEERHTHALRTHRPMHRQRQRQMHTHKFIHKGDDSPCSLLTCEM